MTTPRVVVVGAGYAGLSAAKLVAIHSGAKVVLINDRDVFVDRMRNHQLATGQRLDDLRLRDMLKRTSIQLIIDRVIHIDPERRHAYLARQTEPIDYDVLVYAVGSHADLDSVPGVAEHAVAVATAEQATELRNRMRAARTVAVVGGGLTGIETVTEIAERYPDRTVRLITSGTLGEMVNERGRQHLYQTFDRLGIHLVEHAAVAKVAADGLLLEDGEQVDADVVSWTTGFRVPALARTSGLEVDDSGRMIVDRNLRSLSHPDVFGIGDAAAASDRDGHELRMGCGPAGIAAVAAARAICDQSAGRAPKPLRYKDHAWYISLGRRDGLVQLGLANNSPVVTGRRASLIKEWVVLRGTIWCLRHPGVAHLFEKAY